MFAVVSILCLKCKTLGHVITKQSSRTQGWKQINTECHISGILIFGIGIGIGIFGILILSVPSLVNTMIYDIIY